MFNQCLYVSGLLLCQFVIRWKQFPVWDTTRIPCGNNHVTVGKKDSIMWVLVLLLSKQHRHIDHRNDSVTRVEHCYWTREIRDNGAPILLWVHADVARQRTRAHGGLQVHCVVPFELIVTPGVVVKELQAAVRAVADDNSRVGWCALVVSAPVVGRERPCVPQGDQHNNHKPCPGDSSTTIQQTRTTAHIKDTQRNTVRLCWPFARRVPTPRLVQEFARETIESIDVVAPISIAQVGDLTVRRCCKPCGAVLRRVLTEKPVDLCRTKARRAQILNTLVVFEALEAYTPKQTRTNNNVTLPAR